MGNFEKTYEKINAEQLDKPALDIKEEVKSKFLNDFSQFTPKARRQIVRQSRVLLLPEWDIANAIFFYLVRK